MPNIAVFAGNGSPAEPMTGRQIVTVCGLSWVVLNALWKWEQADTEGRRGGEAKRIWRGVAASARRYLASIIAE